MAAYWKTPDAPSAAGTNSPLAGRPWNDLQRADLIARFHTGEKLPQLAKSLNRSCAAVVHQLRKLGTLRHHDSGWYNQGKLWVSDQELWQLRHDIGDTDA